jgi:tetratricopeptide (TPR) repeat protein
MLHPASASCLDMSRTMNARLESQVRPGSLEEALRNGRKLLESRPDAALAQAHAILRRDANNNDALRLAASAHRLRGEHLEAEQAEVTAIRNNDSDPVLRQAAAALEAGKPSNAARIAVDYLRRQPDDLAAMTLAAEALIAQKREEEAEPMLRQVLGRAPHFVPAERLLVDALVKQAKLKSAREILEARAVQDNAKVLRSLAKVQVESNDLEAAAASFERSLELDDQQPTPWVDYAGVLRFLGRKLESRLAYQRALALDPVNGQAWWGLVSLDPIEITNEQLAEMQDALVAEGLEAVQISNLHFAIAQILDVRSEFEPAFEHFRQGNEIWKKLNPHDPEKLARYVDQSIALLSAGAFGSPEEAKRLAPGPVFVIGMPRSGSTLVDRILGQHSACENVGELQIVMKLASALHSHDTTTPFPEQVARLSSRRVREFAQRYLDRAAEVRHTDKPYYTDKMHMNWRQLPLILRMFPKAPIIDVRRSAMDCCWSNYKMLFARGHSAASDLEWLGRSYRDYVRLMDQVEAVAPGRVLRVEYEKVVDDLECQTRRILDYLGLPFEAACLEYHRSNAPVATASSEQVRRPLNREGMGAWKPYAEWLGPLRAALGPLGAPVTEEFIHESP